MGVYHIFLPADNNQTQIVQPYIDGCALYTQAIVLEKSKISVLGSLD